MSERSGGIKPLAIILLLVAVAFVVVGVIYLTTAAADLPGFIPGKPDYDVATDRKYTKRGLAMLVLALVPLVGAWYASGLRDKVMKKGSTDS